MSRGLRECGVGEHRIFGGDPAAFDFLFLHPARDGFLDGDGADDARVTPFNERGAGGVRRDVVLKTERADLIGGATVGANDFRHGRKGRENILKSQIANRWRVKLCCHRQPAWPVVAALNYRKWKTNGRAKVLAHGQ